MIGFDADLAWAEDIIGHACFFMMILMLINSLIISILITAAVVMFAVYVIFGVDLRPEHLSTLSI